MFRAAAIVFILSILLTTIASPSSTEANHEQGEPEHVFSGYVSIHREKLNDGFVRVTVGPGYGLQPPVQEVALEDIRQGRYEIGVVDPTDGKYSNVMLRFSVTYEGREYQRPRDVRLEPGKFTELNFDIEDWKWSRAQPQQVGEPSRGNDGMTESQKAKLEMERERMEQDAEMRREQMAMSQQRMGRGEPGIQPVMNESPKSGPSRGLFSNRKAGEATSGIDNIMDPTTLTIIGIALTVLTTGMTLFKGN